MQDLISVIIPMYNCEDYVKDCLRQVSMQDYKNIEIICVVEQSDDNTLQLAKSCAEDDDRIIVISQKHQNTGAARNNGLSCAKGKYLCFFDADDVILNNYISKMHQAITTNNSDIVVCTEKTFDNNISLINYIRKIIWNNSHHNKTFNPSSINNIFMALTPLVHNKMFSRDLISSNNIQFSDTYCLNDIYFTCSSLVSANRIIFIKDALYHYNNRYRKHRITNNKINHKNDLFVVYDQLYKKLETNNLFNNYKKAFLRKFSESFKIICQYEYDEDFVEKTCEYLSTLKPWNEMKPEELYINCEFDTSLNSFKVKMQKIKRLFFITINKPTERIDRTINEYSNMINNIKIIREKLKNECNINFTVKDNLIGSIIRKLVDNKKNG